MVHVSSVDCSQDQNRCNCLLVGLWLFHFTPFRFVHFNLVWARKGAVIEGFRIVPLVSLSAGDPETLQRKLSRPPSKSRIDLLAGVFRIALVIGCDLTCGSCEFSQETAKPEIGEGTSIQQEELGCYFISLSLAALAHSAPFSLVMSFARLASLRSAALSSGCHRSNVSTAVSRPFLPLSKLSPKLSSAASTLVKPAYVIPLVSLSALLLKRIATAILPRSFRDVPTELQANLLPLC